MNEAAVKTLLRRAGLVLLLLPIVCLPFGLLGIDFPIILVLMLPTALEAILPRAAIIQGHGFRFLSPLGIAIVYIVPGVSLLLAEWILPVLMQRPIVRKWLNDLKALDRMKHRLIGAIIPSICGIVAASGLAVVVAIVNGTYGPTMFGRSFVILEITGATCGFILGFMMCGESGKGDKSS